ncbi:MAG TPA: nucleotide sugar dehydrogenase [Gemmatimonadaceae bacterium]
MSSELRDNEFRDTDDHDWRISKIGVVGPGIVGMPMAALLARASMRGALATKPHVVVVQRASATSGWKVDAINAGRSPIGGVEPDLDTVVAETVAAGLLSATHDMTAIADADAILICTQTDRDGLGPDYGPLFAAVGELARAIRATPRSRAPVVVFESTLAPSSMHTVVREEFARHGLIEGRDVLLGNSPNRVMPGRLVHRVMTSDKLVAGLTPTTPRRIARLYGTIVTEGTLYQTNSLTAEIVKTLENAYRDVRIAYAAAVARFCDDRDIDFYEVRRQCNEQLGQTDRASADPGAVPTGALLIPTIGVGGHCLPKDGILLSWRRIERDAGESRSLFLESRRINDEAPAASIRLAERTFGSLDGRRVVLMGTAYRFDSEDTRNSPTLTLARLLLAKGCHVSLHDPYVRPGDQNLLRTGLDPHFTQDVGVAVEDADYLFFCTAHRTYLDEWDSIRRQARSARGVFDGCNLLSRQSVGADLRYAGIGRGTHAPEADLVDAVLRGFRIVEQRVANELAELIEFLNAEYTADEFNRADFREVQRLAATCGTGCAIVDPRPLDEAHALPSLEAILSSQLISQPRYAQAPQLWKEARV